MIRIEAIAALALAGLGGATVGTDAYLSSREGSDSAAFSAAPALAVQLPVAVDAPAPPALEQDRAVTLDPVTIYARERSARTVRHAQPLAEPQQERELEICSDWRSLETGPVNRGVRSLCTPGSFTTGP
jgi:hypothetical protein